MGVKSERKYKIKIGPRMRLNRRYSHIAQLVKNSPAMQETPGSIPGLGRYTGEGIGYPLEWVLHGLYWGFSCGSAGKESACSVQDLGSIC